MSCVKDWKQNKKNVISCSCSFNITYYNNEHNSNFK